MNAAVNNENHRTVRGLPGEFLLPEKSHESFFVLDRGRCRSAEVGSCADGAFDLDQAERVSLLGESQRLVQAVKIVDADGVRVAAGVCGGDDIRMRRHGGHAADGLVRAVVDDDVHEVGVDDDIHAAFFKLFLRYGIKRGWYNHNRRGAVPGAEFFDKLKYLGRVLFAAVDHDHVGARLGKGGGAFQRIVHAAFQNQAFNVRADDEILGALRLFAHVDLFAEVGNRRLRLVHLGAEQAVFLQAGLILDNGHRNSHPLERADGVDKMLGEPARVAVKDDGLGGDLADVVDRAEARGHVDQLDVGLALGGGVAQRADPHRVELPHAAVFRDLGVHYDQARQAAVGFQRGDGTLDGKQLFQPRAAHVGGWQAPPWRAFPAPRRSRSRNTGIRSACRRRIVILQ